MNTAIRIREQEYTNPTTLRTESNRKPTKQKRIARQQPSLIKQKIMGGFLMLISIIIPLVFSNGDITASLLLFPLGATMACSKEDLQHLEGNWD